MKVKASLHLHSHEDSEDSSIVDYTLFELIDRAAASGFKVIASTCHEKNAVRPEHIDYAKRKGVLLLSGVELSIEGYRHVLVLNCGSAADGLGAFEDLRLFKTEHPEIFVIAPHPNHGMRHSLSLKKLEKNSDLIDAVEHSWFYSRFFNPNLKTEDFCRSHRLPFIATADAHVFDYFDIDYAVLEIEQLTPRAVFSAIRAGQFKNFTRPKKNLELTGFFVYVIYKKLRSIFRLRKR